MRVRKIHKWVYRNELALVKKKDGTEIRPNNMVKVFKK